MKQSRISLQLFPHRRTILIVKHLIFSSSTDGNLMISKCWKALNCTIVRIMDLGENSLVVGESPRSSKSLRNSGISDDVLGGVKANSDDISELLVYSNRTYYALGDLTPSRRSPSYPKTWLPKSLGPVSLLTSCTRDQNPVGVTAHCLSALSLDPPTLCFYFEPNSGSSSQHFVNLFKDLGKKSVFAILLLNKVMSFRSCSSLSIEPRTSGRMVRRSKWSQHRALYVCSHASQTQGSRSSGSCCVHALRHPLGHSHGRWQLGRR